MLDLIKLPLNFVFEITMFNLGIFENIIDEMERDFSVGVPQGIIYRIQSLIHNRKLNNYLNLK